ncbi:MAG: RNA polymerase sigma factor [Bacteroidota bacterium]
MPDVDERELVLEARKGKHEAFRCLVERHMRRAYTVAYRFVNDHHDAEEIAQEAFVRAYESLDRFRGEAEFGTWLYRIVTNIALNRLKQDKRRKEEALENAVETSDAEDPVNAASHNDDLTVHIERALHELPTLQRAVVILRHLNGLSTKEVSQILHCTEGTVKTHLFRGMEKMRVKLNFLREEVR